MQKRSRRKFSVDMAASTIASIDDNVGRFGAAGRGELLEMISTLFLDVPPELASSLKRFARSESISAEAQISDATSFEAAKGRELSRRWTAIADYFDHYAVSANQTSNPLRRLDMSDGDYVVFPESWDVINETLAPISRRVFVIEIRHGHHYDAPHFLFFSNDGKASARECQKVENHIAQDIWPGMKNVLAAQVEPAYDSNGTCLNMKEVADSPTVGYFLIEDAGNPYSEYPFGAKVYRAGKGNAESEVTA